jgi:ABC-2 type transport system ATP-binding protein
VGLLHRGGILLSKDLDDLKLNIHKVQCVLKDGMADADLASLDRIKTETRGKLYTMTVRGTKEDVVGLIETLQPVFYEIIPLSLEEIFISETEVAGYDIKKLIF